MLIGADKKCWPEPANSVECDDVPQSPLPAQAYGVQTDTAGWGTSVRSRARLSSSCFKTRAELICKPTSDFVAVPRRLQMPTTKYNRPRWANSGTILGLASQLQPLYRNLTELAKTRGAEFDDQGLFMCDFSQPISR